MPRALCNRVADGFLAGALGAIMLSALAFVPSHVSASPASTAAPGAGVWQDLAQADLDGNSWSTESLLGRVVLIDFWATWCAPCTAELPNLRRIHDEFGGDDFVLLGVSLDRAERARVRSFLLRHDIAWPQLHDGRGLQGRWPRNFGVEAVPRTVVVDRHGSMVSVDLRGEALYTVVRDLVARAPRPVGDEDPPR